MDVPAGVSVGVAAGASVGVAVGVTVGIDVGLSVVPRLAVVCRECLPWRLPWRLPRALPWGLPSRLPWLESWTSTGFRDMPRHSVEAHGVPVEVRGVSPVAGGVSVENGRNSRGIPWRPMGTAAVLRQKDK